MFIHSVYFWLKPDLSSEDVEAFFRGVESLKAIDSARAVYVGKPAATDRPVVDRSYTCALTVILDDEAAHDRYQADPIHDRFREACEKYWERVLIYDSVDPRAD